MPGLLGTSLTTDEMWDTLKSIGRGINLGGTSGLLGGPVDMATMLLNNPGMIHPGLLGAQGLGIEKPVMGSKWIESKLQPAGLLPQRQGNWQEGVGELASTFINPMTAAAVAGPKLYAAEQRAIENAMAPTALNKQAGAIVWHGSPHKFDKFDSSKIGTGEGAQAYGHGLYLAESPDVAKSYSGKLASELAYNGVQMNRDSARASKDAAAWALYLANGDKATAKASGLASDKWIDKLDPAKLQPGGSLYKVDLPDTAIAKMLDWDKPLSQQAPGVQAAIKRTRSMLPANAIDDLGGDLSLLYGRDVGADSFLGTMNSIQPNLGEALLQKAGIPGVRYLDGGSRGAGSGTSNFVVFPGNEDILKILERNGQPVGGLLGR
jgi:hypothetical protein